MVRIDSLHVDWTVRKKEIIIIKYHNNIISDILCLIISNCYSYLASVTDVLTSVQKTEESLRRLKKIRDKSTGSLASEIQGISDDEKIRIQLQVDVQSYANMVKFITK